MKIEQLAEDFFTRTDPLIRTMQTLIKERKRLAELQTKTSGYLRPSLDENGKIELGYSPDVKGVLSNIEGAKRNIAKLEAKVTEINAVIEKFEGYGFGRPTYPFISSLREEILSSRDELAATRRAPEAEIVTLSAFPGFDRLKAEQTPSYIAVVEKSGQQAAILESRIGKLETILKEFEQILAE